MDLIVWLRDWGWLLGVVYLAFLVVRESGRPGASERAQVCRNVEDALTAVFVRFEKMMMAYGGHSNTEPRDAYREFRAKVVLLAKEIDSGAREKWSREELRAILFGVGYKLRQFHPEETNTSRNLLVEILEGIEGIDAATPSADRALSKPSE